MKATVDKHNFLFWILSCGRVKNKEKFKKQHSVQVLGNDEITLASVYQPHPDETKKPKRLADIDDSYLEFDTKMDLKGGPSARFDDDVVSHHQVSISMQKTPSSEEEHSTQNQTSLINAEKKY